jgi:hypothetical protein
MLLGLTPSDDFILAGRCDLRSEIVEVPTRLTLNAAVDRGVDHIADLVGIILAVKEHVTEISEVSLGCMGGWIKPYPEFVAIRYDCGL